VESVIGEMEGVTLASLWVEHDALNPKADGDRSTYPHNDKGLKPQR